MEFYRDEISYGKIPHGKISVKILRKNFCAPYCKNRRKIGAKSRQDRRKILCGARINSKSANFLQNLRRNFTAKSSFKAAQSSLKECQKTKKSPPQILTMKFRPQISPGRIALDAGRDLNSRQIFRAKFYAKICIKPAKFIVNFFGRNSLRL